MFFAPHEQLFRSVQMAKRQNSIRTMASSISPAAPKSSPFDTIPKRICTGLFPIPCSPNITNHVQAVYETQLPSWSATIYETGKSERSCSIIPTQKNMASNIGIGSLMAATSLPSPALPLMTTTAAPTTSTTPTTSPSTALKITVTSICLTIPQTALQ